MEIKCKCGKVIETYKEMRIGHRDTYRCDCGKCYRLLLREVKK